LPWIRFPQQKIPVSMLLFSVLGKTNPTCDGLLILLGTEYWVL
jgi:hypothetical protein